MLLLAVLSGFILSPAAPWLTKVGSRWAAWLIALLPLGLLVYFFSFLRLIESGAVSHFSYDWVPSLGVTLSFHLDGLSLLFALLISGIGFLVFVYSGSYLGAHPGLGRFYSYLLIFMASMLGLILADNMIALFLFWELTSISSYLLIGFDHERESARAAALQALLVTGSGGLALLAGFLLLNQIGGSMELSALREKGELIRAHPLYLPVLLLILAGAFTKSAQFPFHFWLPSAMEAPTPVSTYLHSATMVKAGVYLLARLSPILGATPMWELIVIPVGAITMLTGAWLALTHTDLKRILAYSTVSALGMLVLMLGLENTESIQAAMVFLLAHALYKGALFLTAGVIDHETGTRNAEQLGGLYRVMPVVAVAAGLAGLSNAGVPPLFGFISKELVYEAIFGEPLAYILVGIVLLANTSFVAVAGIVAIRPFIGQMGPLPKTPHGAPFTLWLGPMLLALTGLLIGLDPDIIAETIISPAAAAIERRPVSVELALWHGFDPRLALSGAGFIAGAGLVFGWKRFRAIASKLDIFTKWGPSRCYTFSIQALNTVALYQTRFLQSGHLHFYLLIIIVVTIGLVGTSLVGRKVLVGLSRLSDIRSYEVLLAAIILAAAVLVVRSRSRLAAVVSLGVVGYGVALLFLLFSAPDLAMTQFAIETLSVILLVLVLFRMPTYKRYSGRKESIRDAIPALAAGAVVTVMVLAATAFTRESRLAPYFLENSLLLAKGRNIVNVILVDFRGLDTMGEITVLAVAAIGVHSLLRLRSKNERE
jgi:multicomponent Na+:H+ antiporter subunit A